MVAQDPPILDPRHWLPEILLYTNAHREVWAVKRENVTWPDLVQAYQTQGIGKHPDSSWVGTRRVALRYVSSSPPFSTVHATFTAHGATPLVGLHGPP